mmetsp:Transcript_5698/g.15781  ORF Transcript_5698/g.15781 Transcript_5698/m.15781 type:complete len:207 (-) Transcript_5698:1287-1907(-)
MSVSLVLFKGPLAGAASMVVRPRRMVQPGVLFLVSRILLPWLVHQRQPLARPGWRCESRLARSAGRFASRRRKRVAMHGLPGRQSALRRERTQGPSVRWPVLWEERQDKATRPCRRCHHRSRHCSTPFAMPRWMAHLTAQDGKDGRVRRRKRRSGTMGSTGVTGRVATGSRRSGRTIGNQRRSGARTIGIGKATTGMMRCPNGMST